MLDLSLLSSYTFFICCQGFSVRRLSKKVYEDNGLKVTAEVNKKVVNFLDVTLDLTTGRHKPYMKPNTTPLYVSSLSNHPPTIIKNIPLEVNRRLCKLSSTEEDFLAVVEPYQAALDKAGYRHQPVYHEPDPGHPPPASRRTRSRKVTWFNPPFSQSISTNIGKKFLDLIDSCFPEGHELKKIINRNTVKVSYSTMPNMAQMLNQHNTKVNSGNNSSHTGGCNRTRLFAHEWDLKDKGHTYTITWQILARASSYNPSSGMCRLCLKEKFFIMFAPATASLNKRNEVYNSCRHRASKLLDKS